MSLEFSIYGTGSYEMTRRRREYGGLVGVDILKFNLLFIHKFLYKIKAKSFSKGSNPEFGGWSDMILFVRFFLFKNITFS